MIKRLRIKMITITMGVLVVVFAIIILTLNIFMQTTSMRQTYDLLQSVADMDRFWSIESNPENSFPHKIESAAPEPPNSEMMSFGMYFYVKLNHDGEIFETDLERMFGFTQDDAADFARRALAKNDERGTIDNLQYLIAEKDYGKIIVFAERSTEVRMLAQLINISLWVALASFAVFLVFSLFLSKWAVKPVAAAFDKQRRFVSDASHELKTPLTIISANVDVLENEIGENKRLAQIRGQSQRMNLLISDLLTLAKADEAKETVIFSEFDFSRAAESVTLEFESPAFEAGKELSYSIEPGISYTGNEAQLRQLIAILIDNAIKHSGEQGKINVTLTANGEHPQLSVLNTGGGIAKNEQSKIFDRFYRSDESRSRETGGYGLGLSIAKSIADSHRAKISINAQDSDFVEFLVAF